MKSFRFFLTVAVLGVCATSCMKDVSGPDSPIPTGQTKISLFIDDTKDIETRSAASQNERTISDANDSYLLVFDSGGTYKTGEQVAVATAITKNGTQTPVLTTSLEIANGDQLALLVNTGITTMPTFTETSTMSDIANKFPIKPVNALQLNKSGANSGKSLPMSGKMTYASDTQLKLYRSVAKIQLELNTSLSGEYAAGVTNSNVQWFMQNQALGGMTYSPDGAMLYNSSTTFQTAGVPIDPPGYGRPIGYLTDNIAEKVQYFPEYPCATLGAGKVTLTANTWNAARMCMIVKYSDTYYRIDLYDHAAKKFLDFKRNYSYIVKINKVNSLGYSTVAEALSNQGSNLEYEVSVTGDYDNFVTSNGQYAVTTDKSQVTVTNSSSVKNLVKLRCVAANGLANGVSTRSVKLVGANKKDLIPTSQMQLCTSGGSAISNNTLTLSSTDDGNEYQLKFKAQNVALLPSETYVEICYGNVRHYVRILH